MLQSNGILQRTVRDFNPDHITLRCETNDLSSKRTASQIAGSIIELAFSWKSQNNKISISLIVPRNDSLRNKASEVSSRLIHMCTKRNIPYIDHANSIQPENYLNESKLYFNRYGTIVFANSISKFLFEHCWWYHDRNNIGHLLQENFNEESKSCSQLLNKENHTSLTLFRMGLFGAAHEWGEGAKMAPSLKFARHTLQ